MPITTHGLAAMGYPDPATPWALPDVSDLYHHNLLSSESLSGRAAPHAGPSGSPVCAGALLRHLGSARAGRGSGWSAAGMVRTGVRMPKPIEPAVAVAEMRAAGVEPLEPYPGAGRPWRCSCSVCGRVTSPRLISVRQGHRACRYCASAAVQAARKVDADEAASVMLAAGVEPLEPYRNSKAPWRCRCRSCGAEVSPSYGSVASGNRACRYCSKVGAGIKQRRDADEAVAIMRAAGFEPLIPYPGQKKPWVCSCLTCGHSVRLYLDNVMNGKGCRWCSRKAVDPVEAAEVMRRAGLEPLTKYPRVHLPWRCRCTTCGREVAPTYGHVRAGGGGCKYCAGNAVDIEVVMATMTDARLEPLEPFVSTKARWRCRCEVCGREVSPMYESVANGHGCAFCAQRAVDPDEAVELMLRASLRPLDPYPGAGAPWRCECTRCGRIVLPRYGNIRSGWGGCAYCVNQKVDPEVARAAALAVGLMPEEDFPGGGQPWQCSCLTCQRTIKANWASIRAGSGCRYCADHGFWSGSGPAVVYLLVHADFGAVKIGVTRQRTTRLNDHLRAGWSVLDVWRDLDPELAFQAEQAVLRMWRKEGIPDAVAREFMPNGGHTETAALDLVDIARTRAVVDGLCMARADTV